jgi:hypothetical protein
MQLGAYGFRLPGLSGAARLLGPAEGSWPELTLIRVVDNTAAPPHDRVDTDRAQLVLRSGGWVELERVGFRATYHLRHYPRDGDILHPYLAPVAALFARWLGRESLHAGAVLVQGGAWAILGDKEAGKSSTLAHLALIGHAVLSDDVLVLEGTDVFSGPRCIDLRAEPAERFGVGEPLGVVGIRERFRLELGQVQARVPLRGFVWLGWGPEVAIERVQGAERLLALLPHRALMLETSAPADLLDLSSLPFLRLWRPHGWHSLEETGARLIDAVTT